MKHLTTTMCLVLLTLLAATSHAQNRKAVRPSLFKNFPDKIICTEAQLNSLFQYAQGANVSLSLTGNFTVSGPVSSNTVKYNNLQTVVIKLPAFNNTLFSLSKQTSNNNTGFVGRIFNPAYADGFELKRGTNGTYHLAKIDLENILVDCSFVKQEATR